MKLQVTNQSLIPKSYKLKVYPTMRRAKQGFTLVESLVAITILIIGVLGPIAAATRGITDGLYAQNQLVGTYLAQEGLELLSVQIDNNNQTGADFLDGLGPCESNDCAAIFDPYDGGSFSFESCPTPNDCEIAFFDDPVEDNPDFYKSYTGGDDFTGPIFTRKLKVETLSSTEVLLTATVTWTNKPGLPSQEIKLVRYAFDTSI